MDEPSRLEKKSLYVNAVSGMCLQSAAESFVLITTRRYVGTYDVA